MTLAWKTDMPSGRKMVLLSLCDHANNEGECFPSVEAIAHKCSMGQRTVQQHIGALERAGILLRCFRNGRSTLYRLEPRHFCRPAESAGPQDSALPCAASSTPAPQLLHDTPALPAPISISEPSMKSSLSREVVRGTPLPPAWSLPSAWEQWALQVQPTWSAAHVHFIADKFRDYWMAMPGSRGIKADWFAAWRNWCRNERSTGRTSDATQVARWPGSVATNPTHGVLSVQPAPGESHAVFAVRLMQQREHHGMTEPSPASQGATAHTVAPAKSTISSANRAAALDAARALKSRLNRHSEQAHGLCAEKPSQKQFGA